MNCRVNEEKVFPSETVSPVLEKHFIEARLHTDGQKNIERILELQQELARSVATPFYLVVDPATGQQVGGTLAGIATADGFRDFLMEAVEAKERVGRLDER